MQIKNGCQKNGTPKKIKIVFEKICNGQEFQRFSGCPPTDNDLIDIGKLIILWTGEFRPQYKNWKDLDDTKQTWEHFQEF